MKDPQGRTNNLTTPVKTCKLEKANRFFYVLRATGVILFLFTSLCFAEVEIDLNIIAQIESSNNPLAYNPKSQARGLYQITPICLKDYNIENHTELHLQALFDPEIAYSIAWWYLNVRIPQFLKNSGIVDTLDTRLWAYNAGIGKVVKGIKPQETINYIKKYETLTK